MLPSEVLRSQARFQRQALIRGRPLLFTFAGNCIRSAMNGYVLRPPLGTSSANGFASFGTLPSDLKQERVEKWGPSFLPDGYVEFLDTVWATPAERLLSITDGRSGEAWDVIYIVPTAFVENRARIALVRRTPVYNRLVSVHLENRTDNTKSLVVAQMPCRLSPLESSLDQDPDLPGVLTGAFTLECPFVLAGDGVLGAGISPQAAGTRFAFDPKSSIVTDDPSVYGGAGPTQQYRIASVPLDPGGDGHLQKYLVTLK